MMNDDVLTVHRSPITDHRLDGWESRLNAIIEAARNTPYELGTHDCFRVVCSVIEALTGVNRWPEFSGYRTKREALRQIALVARRAPASPHASRLTPHEFESAGDWFFGGPRVDLKLARRGDVVAVQTADGEKHLGVHLGDRVALMAPAGLLFLPLAGPFKTDCRLLCAWRVG